MSPRAKWEAVRYSVLSKLAWKSRLSVPELVFSTKGKNRIRRMLDGPERNSIDALQQASLFEILNENSKAREILAESESSGPAKTFLEYILTRSERYLSRTQGVSLELQSEEPYLETIQQTNAFHFNSHFEGFSSTFPIKRVKSSDISARDFFELYSSHHKPVLLHSDDGIPSWDFEHLKRLFGATSIKTIRYSPSSLEWAGLEEHGMVLPMVDFLEKVQTVSGYPHQIIDTPILSDSSLRDRLGKDLMFPKFFAHDLLKKLPDAATKDAWPSLFIAAQGTESGLHIDDGATHFWMGVVQGAKLFRLFSPPDSFQFAPKNINLESLCFPPDCISHGSDLPVHWAVVGPGDIIFVPANWAHKVDNLAPTIAISGNFVDKSNFDLVLEDTRGRCLKHLERDLCILRDSGEVGENGFFNHDPPAVLPTEFIE